MKNCRLFLILCVFTAPALANVFIEPHLGFESSNVEATATATPTLNSGYNTAGLSYGSRLGYKFGAKIWVAADIDFSSGKNTWVDAVANATAYDFARSDLYLLVGSQIAGRLSGWAGYGFSSANEIKSATASYKTLGTAVKLGLGYEIWKNVSFTMEYHSRTMTDYEVTGSSSVKVDTVYSAYKDLGYRVGFSFPFGR